MPKLNFGNASAADVEAASGVKVYKGELPRNGAYVGTLKRLTVGKIGSGDDKGKNKLSILVEIDDPDYPEYKGAPAWGNLNLTDQGATYVNQFLEALTDGSEAAKKAIRTAFWKTGPIADDTKEHILRIGKVNVNSPNGSIKVLISTKQRTYQGTTSCGIQQYMLLGDDDTVDDEDEIIEDEALEDDVEIEDDDDDPYADDDEDDDE
jgi:hypothetical protein